MKKGFIYIAIPVLGILAFYLGSNISKPEVKSPAHENDGNLLGKPEVKKKIPLPEFHFQMPTKDKLNSIVSEVIGLTEKDFHLRNIKVWKLRKENLSKDDFEAFYSFLKSKPEKAGAQLALHSVKNDLLVFIIDDGRYKESTASLMLNIINDPNQHEVMREYVIQYIPDYFEKHWLNGNGDQQQEKKNLSALGKEFQNSFINSMWKMVQTTDGPIPGTALIRLHELSQTFNAIDSKRIEVQTEKMINDPNMSASGRMAALSVALEKEMVQIVDQSSQMTFDESLPISLRMAAMNTTAVLSNDKLFIEDLKDKFLNDPNVDNRLKRAALLITQKLQRKRG